MKKLLFVAVAFTLLISAPAVSFSQGFSLLPGGLFGSPGTYSGDYGIRGLDPLSFYVGWMEPGADTRFAFDGKGTAVGVTGLQHRWPSRGLWLGVAEKVNVSDFCGIGLEAWWLIPSSARGKESETQTAIVPIFNGTFIVPTPVTGPAGATWDTKPDWWFLDGRLIAAPLWSNFSVLAGFRYDHFSTRFQFPSDIAGPAPLWTDEERGDVTVNSYIPYVGFEYKTRSANYLCLRTIGFPWVPADVQYNETYTGPIRATANTNFNRRGYFFEFFGECGMNVLAGASLGAFFRWNYLNGRGDINTDFAPAGLSTGDQFTFDRNTITFGGKLALPF